MCLLSPVEQKWLEKKLEESREKKRKERENEEKKKDAEKERRREAQRMFDKWKNNFEQVEYSVFASRATIFHVVYPSNK